MDKYLEQNIKDIIAKYPGVGDILNEYKIGCTACAAGTCRLKDIVEIHNLPGEEEEKLMGRIALAISPKGGLKVPRSSRKAAAPSGGLKYSPPLKRLVDEHVLIKRLLALIPRFVASVDLRSEEGAELARGGLKFIRTYADKYHHAKEEDILFKYFDGELDVIKTMLQDHVTGRNHVKAADEALAAKDGAAAAEHFLAYRELLSEHIKKEDEILYPWMDRNLSLKQVGELSNKFNEADEKFEPGLIAECEAVVTGLEKNLGAAEKSVKA
ncbi:MAG: hemerythrin domain-containing protein [Elusimicrobiota bacterium]|nr:hemerythrin domain-containing protein [Elusimicrobiota bacterium]